MSKFFKWLKKDKPKKESPVVNDVLPQMTEEPVTPVAKSIENNSSSEAELTVKHNKEIQPEQAKSTPDIEPNSFIKKEVETSLTELENNKSYIEIPPDYAPETNQESVAPQSDIEATAAELDTLSVEQQDLEKAGFFSKLKRSLSRTKESIGSGIINLFKDKTIDDELFEELETQLLVADVGIDTTVKIIKQLTESSDRKQLKDGDALYQLLKQQMADILKKVESPLTLETESGPFVILMVGVNGVGKTTTIGKMAKQFQQQGKKVMLAAGDTFRAAAVEQLEVWGERNNIPVVAQQTGSDSASVIYDAFQSAKAKNVDVLIADTAGRLQNKEHLMEELKKVVRVIKKIAPQAPHEIMLTLDAGTGQNAISQTKLFNEAVGITGISLTKLDGTAKGGVIFAIADQFDIPIRYVGIGEGIDDLRPFNSEDFVNALFTESESQ